MLNNVYICLDWYNYDELAEIEKYNNNLKEKNSKEIFNKFYSKNNTYEENSKIMEYTTSLEYFMFINYLKENKWYNLKNIITLTNPSLFILNNKLYQIKNNKIIQLNINKVWFFSLRWINWQHPFFFILKSLLKQKWSIASRNNDFLKMSTRWKFFALNSLYDNWKNNLIWSIIIPFNIKKEDYELFKNFIYNKLWNNILIKKDFYSCWEWNFPISLENYDEFQKNKFEKALFNNEMRIEAVYIVPIEKFTEEYRVYFTKIDWKISIYSVKNKSINIDIDEITRMDVFKYWWFFEWDYIDNNELKNNYNFIIKKSIKYIKNLDYNCWNLEFGKNINGKFVFFEVNTMGSVMPYKWEDTKNIIEYYNNLFKTFI